MKMSKEFWEELQRRTERKKQTVMASEGKNPLAQKVSLDRLDRVPDSAGRNTTFLKRYDAPIVIITKLEHGTIWVLQEDGTPCLSSDNPAIREAHWHSLAALRLSRKHLPKWWMIAGFWTVNARSEIYDLPTPFQVFEVGDGEGYVEPHEDLRAWCDTFNLSICPKLDNPPTDYKCVVHLSNDLGFVEQRAICGGEYNVTTRYRTNNMPHGLIQYHIQQSVYSGSTDMKLYLKQMGLPY